MRDSTKRQYQSALNAYLRSGYPLPAQALDVANYLEHAHALRKVKGGGWQATEKPLSISACEVALAAPILRQAQHKASTTAKNTLNNPTRHNTGLDVTQGLLFSC